MALWSWLKRLFGKKPESPPPTSLVFLLRESRYLDDRIVRQAIKNGLGVDLSDTGPDSTEFVVGGEGLPTYFVRFQDRMLLVHNFPMPYFDDKQKVAEEITDLRLRKAVLEHQAWLSVDALSAPETDDDVYQILGKVLAELADEDCLAIVGPALQQMNPWEADLEATLRGPRPLDAVSQLTQVPVIAVADDDPMMLAAVAEARRRWPEFVAAFEQRHPDQKFSVKAPFRDGEFEEFIWIEVSAIEQDAIYGAIGNDPVELKNLELGSRVQVQVKDLKDWLFLDGGDVRGGFTIEVVQKAARRQGQ